MHGGVFELQNGPVANAVALRVDANADPKATPAHPAFQWFAVVPDGDANAEAADTMTLKHNEQAGNALAPGKLQRATLTHFGTADKALLFGGDDGLTVKGETWTLETTTVIWMRGRLGTSAGSTFVPTCCGANASTIFSI